MARKTKEDAQATRAALLDAAERVFDQRGVTRTSLADVAKAAGVTRGALYWHFADKADLFNAMMKRATAPLGAPPEPTGKGDPLAELVDGLQQAFAHLAQNEHTRRVVRIAMHKVELADDMNPVIERAIARHRLKGDRLRQLLTQAAAARGATLPAPAEQLAHGLHGLIGGLIHGWLLDERFDLPATGRAVIAAYLRGSGLGDVPGPGDGRAGGARPGNGMGEAPHPAVQPARPAADRG